MNLLLISISFGSTTGLNLPNNEKNGKRGVWSSTFMTNNLFDSGRGDGSRYMARNLPNLSENYAEEYIYEKIYDTTAVPNYTDLSTVYDHIIPSSIDINVISKNPILDLDGEDLEFLIWFWSFCTTLMILFVLCIVQSVKHKIPSKVVV